MLHRDALDLLIRQKTESVRKVDRLLSPLYTPKYKKANNPGTKCANFLPVWYCAHEEKQPSSEISEQIRLGMRRLKKVKSNALATGKVGLN